MGKPLATIDPDKFLHAWRAACTAADRKVGPLQGATVTLRDGRQLCNPVADNPTTRFLGAIASVFRTDAKEVAASGVARIVALLQLAAEGTPSRWIRSGKGGPRVHEALIRSAAQARFTSLAGFDFTDLETLAERYYEEGEAQCGSARSS